MRYTDLLETVTAEQFDEWLQWHLESHRSGFALKKMMASEIGKQFQMVTNSEVYHAWVLSETRADRLQHAYYKGPWSNRIKVEPQPLVVKYKSPIISYSWTKAGAMTVAQDDRFSNGVTVITKVKLQSANDVLLNIYEYGRKHKHAEARLITREKEVILPANDYYTRINPADIIYAK